MLCIFYLINIKKLQERKCDDKLNLTLIEKIIESNEQNLTKIIQDICNQV